MNNFFDFIEEFPSDKRLRVNELLLVEYQCPINEPRFDIWSHQNYFIFVVNGQKFVVNGQKKWATLNQEIDIGEGDCLFVRKGAHSVVPYFESNPCVLLLFVPDQFIRSVILENKLEPDTGSAVQHSLFPMDADDKLTAYFHSFFSYLSETPPPDEKLLELKFRELILMIASGTYNKKLTGYFAGLCRMDKPSLRDVMEANYNYPMKLEEYARLSGRSLSAFKRDFKKLYSTSPGRWLIRKRIELAKYLLKQTGKSITEIVIDSGFKSNSHFHRVFKKIFNMTPLECRKKTDRAEK